MKSFLTLIFFTILAGCQQNNGNIGSLFGLWKITAIEINEKSFLNNEDDLYFAFQGEVINLKKNEVWNHSRVDIFGSFIHQEDSLFINCSEGNLSDLPIWAIYNKNWKFKILFLDNKHISLSHDSIIWNLSKY